MKMRRFLSLLLLFALALSLAATALAYDAAQPLPGLTGDQAEDVAAIAESQIGYRSDGGTVYGAWWGDVTGWGDYTGQPWCAMFACWCAAQAGAGLNQAFDRESAAAQRMMQWYQKNATYDGAFLTEPRRGDFIFFGNSDGEAGHVAIVTGYAPSTGKVTFVGGNQNGGMVTQGSCTWSADSKYGTQWVLGYGRPDYKASSGIEISFTEFKHPTVLAAGEGFSVGGLLQAEEPLKKVVLSCQTAGGIAEEVTLSVDGTTVDLVEFADELHFENLEPGMYQYCVTAATEDQAEILLCEAFAVLPPDGVTTIDPGEYDLCPWVADYLAVDAPEGTSVVGLVGRTETKGFTVTAHPEGGYTVRQRATGLLLTLDPLENVYLAEESETEQQRWQILPWGDAWCLLPAAELSQSLYAKGSTVGAAPFRLALEEQFLLLPAAPQICDGGADCPGAAFEDMPVPEDWAHSGIDFVVERGLFQGMQDNQFAPDGRMTRAMLVTVLWRQEGSPAEAELSPFLDVEEDVWYAEAVAWAARTQVVKGTSETLFSPHDDITREQLATILYRYAALTAEVSGEAATLERFDDAASVSPYAGEAVRWAVSAGIISGTVDEEERLLLEPQGFATRAQVAAMLMRLLKTA